MSDPQPNNTDLEKRQKSKSKHEREERSVQEILASDDEFLDISDDSPNIPAYLIDEKFDQLSFPWLDEAKVKHFDTEIPYESDDDADKKDTKETYDIVESPPHGLDKSTGSIKKTKLTDTCDDYTVHPITYPWASLYKPTKKDLKEIYDNVESPPHGLEKSTGAIKKTKLTDTCDDYTVHPITFPWVDVGQYGEQINYASLYKPAKQDIKEACDNVESPPHGLEKSTGAIKTLSLYETATKYTNETYDNVESPPHGLEKSTGAIKNLLLYETAKKDIEEACDNVKSPPHGLEKSTGAIKNLSLYETAKKDIKEACDNVKSPPHGLEKSTGAIKTLSLYETAKKDVKEACDNVKSPPHGLEKSTGAIKNLSLYETAKKDIKEACDNVKSPPHGLEKSTGAIKNLSLYETAKKDIKEACDNVKSPPHGLEKSTGAIKTLSLYEIAKKYTNEVCANVKSPPHGLDKSTGAIKKTKVAAENFDTPNNPTQLEKDKSFFLHWVLNMSRNEDSKKKKRANNKANRACKAKLQIMQSLQKSKSPQHEDNSNIVKDGIDDITFQNMTIKEDEDLQQVKEPNDATEKPQSSTEKECAFYEVFLRKMDN